MRSNGVFVALVLLANSRAQTPAPAAVPDKPASLEGAVTHATTGEPLPRVHVRLRGNANGTEREYGAMTLADGKFSITGITPGHYTVIPERTGFMTAAGPSGFTVATLKADEKKSDFNLKLIPTGALTGRVVDSEGEPVEGANVTAEGGSTGGSGTTDEKGEFRIGGLAPGRYRVKAAVAPQVPGPPEIRSDGTVDMHYASIYYPGAVTRKEAGHVEVRSDGETSGVDIRLARVPWVKVSGTVTGNFRPTDHVFIMAQKEGAPGGQASSNTIVKPDGSFVLWRLDPGTYYIRGTWGSPGGQYQQTGSVAIDVAASNIEKVDLRFIPNFDLAGRLEYETEEAKQLPQMRANTSASSPAQAAQQPKVRRMLTLRDVSTAFGQTGAVQVQDDDTFVFPKIPPGRYRIVPSWGTAWVKSTRLGGNVADGPVIDLNSGSNSAELSVMLSAASASITGTVRDEKEKPMGTLVVLVEDAAGPPATPRSAPVNGEGTYSFPYVPPGRYRIVAIQPNDLMIPVWRPLERIDFEDIEDLMESFELHAGDKLTKDLNRQIPDGK